MGINETISPAQATNNYNSLMTVINGERNVCTITYAKDTENMIRLNQGMDNNGIMGMINKAGLHGLKIKSNPNNVWIVYRPGYEKDANELNTLAEKYGGYLSVNTTKADSIRIGQLLSYNQADIDSYIDKNYSWNPPAEKTGMFEGKLNEYVTKDEVYLRDYFNMTEEQKKSGLPYDYYWFFKDFLIEYDIDFKLPTHAFIGGDGEEEPGDEYEDAEIIDWLARNNKPLFDQFADYLYKRIEDHELDIPDAEYPAWSYFGKSKLIKPQWLIHFTNDPWPIAKNGFTRGVSEIEKLGLTTHLGEFEKKYGGYNFAFRAEIYHRYAKGRHGYKYGEEAIMFIGSGMEMYHRGDEEPQVIFWGKNAKNIVPITKEFDDYIVHNLKSGGIIYKNTDLDEVVSWVMRNYQQYQNIINYEPNRKNNETPRTTK